jgi:hypothetical protein
MRRTVRTTGIIAMAAALSAASPANSQTGAATPAASSDVSVALVDLGANQLYSNDPNVRFVDLTPPAREGFKHAVSKVSGLDHGDVVAQTFVQEYRKLDPNARITIYTVNPFLEKHDGGQMTISRAMLRQALPQLTAADVKVAITTFGVSDEKAGTAILDDMRSAGLVVFAASPNKKDDDGIWPAASPKAIAVADGATNDAPIYKNRRWSGWVDMVANGQFHKGTIDVEGSSFATPRAAAYGVRYMTQNPNATTEDVRRDLLAAGDNRKIGDVSVIRVGGEDMVRRFSTASPRSMASRGAPANGATEMAMMQMSNGR